MKSIWLWHRSSLLGAFLLSALMLGSCTPLPAPSTPRAFREWLPALRERSEYWQRYQARVRIKAESADKRFTLDAAILANLPGQLRLEAFRLGQTVGVLIFNHDQSSLFVPSEKLLLSAAHSEDLTNHLLGIGLPLDSFGYTLSATLAPALLEGFEVTPRQQDWLGVTRPGPEAWSSEWQFSSEPQAVTSLKIHRGGWDYTVRYDPPVGLAVEEIPRKITFTSGQWQVEATVQELKPVGVGMIADEAFRSEVGTEVRRVKVRAEK